MSNAEIRAQVRAIKEITRLFLWERVVYLLSSIASIVLFFVVTIVSIHRGDFSPPSRVLLIGNTGAFILLVGRVKNMWDKAIYVIAPSIAPTRKSVLTRVWAWVSDKIFPDEL